MTTQLSLSFTTLCSKPFFYHCSSFSLYCPFWVQSIFNIKTKTILYDRIAIALAMPLPLQIEQSPVILQKFTTWLFHNSIFLVLLCADILVLLYLPHVFYFFSQPLSYISLCALCIQHIVDILLLHFVSYCKRQHSSVVRPVVDAVFVYQFYHDTHYYCTKFSTLLFFFLSVFIFILSFNSLHRTMYMSCTQFVFKNT